MNKIAVLALLCAVILNARGKNFEETTLNLSASELFKHAASLESKGDTLGAMRFYKQAAKQAMSGDIRVDFGEPSNKGQSAEQNAKQSDGAVLPSELANFSKQEQSDLATALDNTLGIKLYHLNYLLPITYAKSVPNDGRKKLETKFQFSVQKPIFYDVFGLKESLGVAYSQTSLWQTARPSAPFRESNYRPEIFINFDTKEQFGGLNLTQIQTGFLHESNGRDGAESRSWNRIYAQAKFDFGAFSLTPRVWTTVGSLSDNPDIKSYLGRADLSASMTYKGHIFNALFRSNLHFDNTHKGAVQLDWLFPIGSGFYGYLQYFSGYGESLIDYNHSTDKVGIGIALLR